MSDTYRGIVGAPTTPFNSNNEVDLHIFAKQINFLIESGVSLIAHPMHKKHAHFKLFLLD